MLKMSIRRVRGFAFKVALICCAGFLAGCGGPGDGDTAVPDEEYQQQTEEMLQNYGQMYQEQYQQ